MFRQNLWKLLLSVAVLIWAVAELNPIRDREFGSYIQSKATAKPAEFISLMKEVSDRVASKQAPSVFMALKQIGRERKLDLSQFFPEFRLEASLKNVDKRNNILLDELLKRSKGRLQLGLDLKGGVGFTLEVNEKAAAANTQRDNEQKLNKAIEIISTRINGLGVSEPIVRPLGNNRIEVQLAGVTTKDNPEIISSLKKPARLDFRLVYSKGTPQTIPASEAPPGFEVMTLEQEGRNGEIRTSEEYVKRIPEMTGDALSDAYATMDEFGRFKILLRFTKQGGRRFAEVTKAIAEEGQRVGHLCQLAIVLDGKLYSAPTVHEEIPSGSAEITGQFTQREALELANVLNNPLDLPLDIKEQYEVGPSLAQDAIDSGLRASIIGSILVAAFMITYYTVGGVIAVGVLAVNITIILGVLASIGATMTLPGLAGIVLTVGMAVNANILIFERMREELHLGKTLKTALVAGYEKAFFTIVDAHVTQLCICAIMIWLGTGPVKGFGVTLAIGVFSTMFSVLITGHLIMEYLINYNIMTKFPMLHMLRNIQTDFIRYAKPAFIISWVIVLTGISVVVFKGRRAFGTDFLGGDVISIEYDRLHQPDLAEVRRIASEHKINDTDGKFVAFSAPDDLEKFSMKNERIYLRAAGDRGGRWRKLGSGYDGDLSIGFWSNDGGTIYFNDGVRATEQCLALDVQRDVVRQVTSEKAALTVSRDRDTGVILIRYADPATPPTLFAVPDAASIGARARWVQLTDANPQVRQFALGEEQEITWKSKDGRMVGGVLIRPVGYQAGQRYPLIVSIHGGPAGADVLGFNGGYGAQIYAGAGYVVLMPNYRGSTNYGEAFKNGIVNNYFAPGFDDIMAGVDFLIAQGIADGTKMGALGWSAGGHWSNWILTHTDRFKAISSGAGTSNWISMYAESDTQRVRQFYLGNKLPYDDFDAYLEPVAAQVHQERQDADDDPRRRRGLAGAEPAVESSCTWRSRSSVCRPSCSCIRATRTASRTRATNSSRAWRRWRGWTTTSAGRGRSSGGGWCSTRWRTGPRRSRAGLQVAN